MTSAEGEKSARNLFFAVAAIFLAVGAMTSAWISLAQFDDPFCFGRHYLWGALDPAAVYFGDAVDFYSTARIEHFLHPGVTLDFVAGTIIRTAALGATVVDGPSDYFRHVALHRFFYFGLAGFLTTLLFLGCCRPLFRIAAMVLPRDHAYSVCTVFLGSIPALLFVNRLAPEAYMLFFGLWCAALTLMAVDSPGTAPGWLLSGACLGLSVLSKPFLLPLAALSAVVILVFEPARSRATRIVHLTLFGSGFSAAVLGLSWKVPWAKMLEAWQDDQRANRGLASPLALFSAPSQAPLLGWEVALACASLLGGWAALRRDSIVRSRRAMLILAALVPVLLLPIARRPQWHYLFGVSWILMLLAVVGIEWLLRRFARPNAAMVGIVAVIALSAWGYYPGVAAAYYQYGIRFRQRLPIARSNPLSLPAPWEKRVGDSDLSEVWPVHSFRLEDALKKLRGAGEP